MKLTPLNIALIAGTAVLSAVFVILFFAARSKYAEDPTPKRKKIKKRLFLAVILFSWAFVGSVFNMLIGGSKGITVEFDLFSERMNIFGFSVAKTSVYMWAITAIIAVLCLIFRLFIFPRFSADNPKGLQNVIETCVEFVDKFARDTLCDYSGEIAPYMFSLALFMLGAAGCELFGLRAPTSDIAVTLAMGLITFFMINFYGIRKKGIGGRLASMCKPNPVMFPMKVISDVAVPVSLACRLFGNMLGGMIVMDLLKGVLGGYRIGVIPVAGLYFNLFHPIIQIYIFIILSMTFINEAIE